jgi:GT2 family glycosyltransferase
MEKKVAIIILNWNGLADTLECLESVFCSDYRNFQVFVCDNASEVNPVADITLWCEGRLEMVPSLARQNLPLKLESSRMHRSVVAVSQFEAESGQICGGESADVIIIRNNANLGFAGGNNVALRYVLSRDCYSHVWLLNNDTVVTPHALGALVKYAEEHHDVGICGSKLLYYHNPGRIQACGGAVYNKWLGIVSNVEDDNAVPAPELSYIVGASMLMTDAFLRGVGLLSEEYFLYFEELDLARRAEGKFSLGYAPESVVYHKEGASAGSSSTPATRSAMSDYYLVRSRLIFSKKFYPYTLPSIYLCLVIVILRRVFRLQFGRIPMMLKAAIGR